MRTKEEVLRFALSLGDAYQDAPFDGNWQLVRLRKNRRTFVFVYDRELDPVSRAKVLAGGL